MDRGLYASTSGGLLNAKRIDIVSNNLANVNTVGFKAQRLISRQQTFEDTLASTLEDVPRRAPKDFDQVPGVVTLAAKTDFTPGPIQYTGNPLDVALRKSNHFFVVQTPEGEALTRAGNFRLDAEGRMVTPDGLPVLGDGGDLTIPSGTPSISQTGEITAGGISIGRLRVVQVANLDQLERTEGVRFRAPATAQVSAVDADVESSAVEMPNVSVVEAMVDMISAQKGFEAYSKTVRTIDELNERSIRNARSAS